MCGILGNFGYIYHKDIAQHLDLSRESLLRRGPNQNNILEIENLFAFHSRLIIQGDENDGIQPIIYKHLAILFNGNLYNKNELKLELQSHGYKFDGASDTEVVAASLYHWGSEAFNKFNGFFSIACFNKEKKTLILARDRLGQKPLYYSQTKDSVFFGSTENMIPKKFIGQLRNESIYDFLTYGYIPAPNTMFQNLLSLEPGAYIEFTYFKNKISKVNKSFFWQPNITNEIDNYDEALELISNAINDSIHEGLQASVDVACLLSGGVDSSLMFSYAKEVKEDLIAITADFGIGDDAKLRASSVVASLKHDNHLVKNINSEDVKSTLNNSTKICHSPFDDTSIIPSSIVFGVIKDSGYSAAITGDGADELFCGYSSFGNLKKMEFVLNKKFDRCRQISAKILSNPFSKLRGIEFDRFLMNESSLLKDLMCNGFKIREWEKLINVEYDPLHYLANVLEPLEGSRPLDKLRILNLKFKLPYQMLYKIDRASMFNSIEARPLLLNNKVIDSALQISSSAMLKNGQKSILKSLYQRKIPNAGWKLPKTGFGWKTENYSSIFTQEDNFLLKDKIGIDGFALLKNKKRHHKRGYYGLFSLSAWLKEALRV
ncbi:MAG: asparagine synthase-related protein [Gammaproteobacteria bacterium]